MKITLCFKQLEPSHNMIADTKARLSDFKLGKKLFYILGCEILKIVN